MKFEQTPDWKPSAEPEENRSRFRAIAKRLEKMPAADQAEVLRQMEQYKTAFQKNPAPFLEATEILMEMLSDSRRRRSDVKKEEMKEAEQLQESVRPLSNIDPELFEKRLEEFRIAAKHEGLEMAHDDMTDKEDAKQRGVPPGDLRSYDSHGKRGRKRDSF